jgi:hypothetical protein
MGTAEHPLGAGGTFGWFRADLKVRPYVVNIRNTICNRNQSHVGAGLKTRPNYYNMYHIYF